MGWELWPEGRADAVREMWSEGFSASHIASKFPGLTRNAVIGKLHRMNLPKRQRAERRERKSKTPSASRGLKMRTPRKFAGNIAKPGSVIVARNPEHIAPPRTMSIRFLDRRPDQCSFIEDEEIPIIERRCCGAGVREHSSYCNFHHTMCYRPAPIIRDRQPKDFARSRKNGMPAAQVLAVDFEMLEAGAE